MRADSKLGQRLWIALLVALSGWVISDFARSPFTAPAGSAAVPRVQLTIAVPSTGPAGEVAVAVAGALERQGLKTRVRTIRGGSSDAVVDFFSRGSGPELLLVGSTALADIAHDRRDRLVPGASESAALARELLRRARPVGLVSSDPLRLAVTRGNRLQSGDELLSELRAEPERWIFALDDATWFRDELAALVERAGVDGRVRFGVFSSGGPATAVADGSADVALFSGRPPAAVAGRSLRPLSWPAAVGRAPRAWVGLVGRPGLGSAELGRLRRRLAGLSVDPGWQRRLAAGGHAAVAPRADLLTHLLRAPGFDRLERISRRVEAG
jgi:hypothetical protein